MWLCGRFKWRREGNGRKELIQKQWYKNNYTNFTIAPLIFLRVEVCYTSWGYFLFVVCNLRARVARSRPDVDRLKDTNKVVPYHLLSLSPFFCSLSPCGSLSRSLRIGEISLKWYKVTSERLTNTHHTPHTHTHTHTHSLTRHASVALAAQRDAIKAKTHIHTHTSPVKHTHWQAQSHTQIHTTCAATHKHTHRHPCMHTHRLTHPHTHKHTLRAVV